MLRRTVVTNDEREHLQHHCVSANQSSGSNGTGSPRKGVDGEVGGGGSGERCNGDEDLLRGLRGARWDPVV